MRFWLFTLVFCMGLAASAADQKAPHVSKKDRQAAAKEFSRALELQKSGHVDEALEAVSVAVQLDPGNVEYVTAREMLRQQLAGGYLSQGNRLAQGGDKAGAAAKFRAALAIDPENSYAKQRLHDMTPEDPERQQTLELLASVDQVRIAPAPGKKSIHVQGDTRSAYAQIGQAFNVSVLFDQGLTSRSVRFDLDDADFYTAMSLIGKMTKTFWAPVTSREVIVAGDNQEMRRQYERFSLRTFYLGNATSATDLQDVANVLKTVFEMRFVTVDNGRNAIVVRGPREVVDAAGTFIEGLMDARPELMVDLQALEIDTTKAAQYGITLPTSFVVFNIPSEIRRVLGADAQAVINQLLQTGTINPATIPASALANLQGSPLLAPFLFFGKGYGLTGVVTNPITGNLSLNTSVATVLDHVTLRATDGETATFRVGDRFPIAIGSFSTIAVSGTNAANLGSVPQFQYEDLGLTFTVKPHYQAEGDVKLDFELQIQGLGTASLNNVPELTRRSFKGNITAKAGEPSVVAGEINDQELRSTRGYPAIGKVSGLTPVLNNNSNQVTHSQILVVVTPYVVRKPFHGRGSNVFWSLGP
jgi:type II secretory pathway component GspD/PulD (secretin)